MSFIPANLQKSGPTTIPGGFVPKVPQLWSYYAVSDTIEQVLTPGYFRYFADFTTSTLFYPELAVNDLIYVVANNVNAWITVLSIQPNIVTSNYAGSTIPTAGVISASLFNGMYAAPILLVPPAGTNTILFPTLFALHVVYGTAAFTAGGAWYIQYGSAAHGAGVLATQSNAASIPLGWTANSLMTMPGVITGAAGTNTASTIVNEGLYLSNATQAFATGDSTIYFKLDYTIL